MKMICKFNDKYLIIKFIIKLLAGSFKFVLKKERLISSKYQMTQKMHR